MKRSRVKKIAVALICILAFGASSMMPSEESWAATNKEIHVVNDGQKLSFDQSPIMVNDRVMVPIRTIFELLGYSVQWDGNLQMATAKKAGNEITVCIDDPVISHTKGSYTCDVPPMIINGRTLVPVRAISECAGCTVDWRSNTQTVMISNGSTTDNTDLFWRSIEGIWVDLSQAKSNRGDVTFPFYQVNDKDMVYGVYPGGYDRTGEIINVKETSNNTFDFTIHYPEEYFMMEYCPEEYVDCAIKLLGAPTNVYAIRFLNSSYDSTWTLMGGDLEAAKQAVRSYAY